MTAILRAGRHAPELHRRRDRRATSAPTPTRDTRRVDGRGGRRERRHVPAPPARRRARHQHRARPPRPVGDLRGARRPGSRSSSPLAPGPAGAVRRQPASPRPSPTPCPPSPTASIHRRATGRVRTAGSPAGRRSISPSAAPSSPTITLAHARAPQRAQRRGCRGARARAGRAGARPCVDGLAEFGGMARRFEFRGHLNGADFYDDYAHTAGEVAATLALAREVAADVLEGESPQRVVAVLPAASLHAHLAALHRSSPTRSSTPTSSWSPGSTARRRIRSRGCRAGSSSTRSSTGIPKPRSSYLPEWDALRDLPWRYARPGDLVVTLGCGDITRVHDEWIAEGRRRGRRMTDLSAAIDLLEAGFPGQVRLAVPSGELTTYQGRRSVRRAGAARRRRRRSMRWRRSSKPSPSPCSSSGEVRTFSSPTRASPVLPSCSATDFERGRRRPRARHGAGRGLRRRLPVVARQAAAAGVVGTRVLRRHPGKRRWCRAHERGRARQGDARRARRRRPPRSSQRRVLGAHRGRPASSATAAPISPITCVVLRGPVRGSSRHTRGVRRPDRRDRALAARAPARRSQRRIGVLEPARRQRGASHRSRGLEGSACGWRGREREARQLHRRRPERDRDRRRRRSSARYARGSPTPPAPCSRPRSASSVSTRCLRTHRSPTLRSPTHRR